MHSTFENNEQMTEVERDILLYIYENKTDDYSDIIQKDGRWEVFYHLGSMRTSLIDWYDFGAKASVLEVGAEFGALTGSLCKKCKKVTALEKIEHRSEAIKERYKNRLNLHVINTDFLTWESDERYDYIIMNGILETLGNGNDELNVYASILKKANSFLNVTGKIIFSVDNKIGVSLLAGQKEKYIGYPYVGINSEKTFGKGRLFTKREIEKILLISGIKNYKFFYPMPNYITPQVIYSDDYLPNENANERVVFYHPFDEYLLIDEKQLLKLFIENGSFTSVANSYMVECCNETKTTNISYATVTADRGRVHGQVTTISVDKYVKKEALFPEGYKMIKQLYDNIRDISAHGVNVVQHELVQSGIVMPYINKKALSEEIYNIANRNPDDFIKVFDALYECILNSSEHVEDSLFQYEGQEELGVILDKAYIDMVPFNCFYINGTCWFYDQEFVREKYPAKYTLFRALMYTYLHAPYLERVVSLTQMKKRYGLEKLWKAFKDEEKRFISENRNYEVYNHYYDWVKYDTKQIFERDKLLSLLFSEDM